MIKNNFKNINEKYLGVFRDETLLIKAKTELEELFQHLKNITIKNKNLLWKN